MDELLASFGQSLAHAGPGYVVSLGVIAIAAWIASKALPFWSEYQSKKLEIDQAREKRKADESARQDERERERAVLEGRWLEQYEHATEVQKQTNAVLGGVEAQIATLNVTLADSKERSRNMAKEMHDVHRVIIGKDKQ